MKGWYLGLDGGLKNFGLCVAYFDNKNVHIEKLIISKTAPSKAKDVKRSIDDLTRFRQHAMIIRDTIQRWEIGIAVGEIPAGAKDARALYAFGGVLGLYASLDIPFIPVTPSDVKIAAAGNKHADKEDIIEAMYSRFPYANWITSKRANKMEIKSKEGLYLTPDNEHLADSIGAVLAGIEKL